MNSFNKALQKLCNATFKGFYVFAAFTFTVLLTILLVNVISRNLLGGSIAWIEEISRYIFTWMMASPSASTIKSTSALSLWSACTLTR